MADHHFQKSAEVGSPTGGADPLDLEPIQKRLWHVTRDTGPTAFLQAHLEHLATRDVPKLLAEVARLRLQVSAPSEKEKG